MAREHDDLSKRPERVIILDADDPMTEIHGRFVWQEEHDRVVDQVRRQAFADGYRAAQLEQPSCSVEATERPQHRLGYYMRMVVAVLLGLLVLLMLPIIFF